MTIDLYNQKVYDFAVGELRDVKWEGCPYDIESEFLKLTLRHFSNISVEELKHDIQHAIADVLNGGVELETI